MEEERGKRKSIEGQPTVPSQASLCNRAYSLENIFSIALEYSPLVSLPARQFILQPLLAMRQARREEKEMGVDSVKSF